MNNERERPVIVALLSVVLSMQAALAPFVIVAIMLMPEDSPLNYGGAQLPVGNLRQATIASVVLWFAFAAYVGPGLWKGRPLARHLLFFGFVGMPFFTLFYAQAWERIPYFLIYGGLVGWYLCDRDNMKQHFRSSGG